MTWDAAVVVVRGPGGKVLGVSRGSRLSDMNLPGGMREPGDASPADTARRELLEETGIEVADLRPLAKRASLGRRVMAFESMGAPRGKLKASSEGVPLWVKPKALTRATCTFQRENSKLLEL